TDNYIATMAPHLDRAIAQTEDPDLRRRLHAAKLGAVQSAITITASANPVVALLDMTVMVSLQNRAAKYPAIAQMLGEQVEPTRAAIQRLHDTIWELAGQALTAEQQEELHTVI